MIVALFFVFFLCRWRYPGLTHWYPLQFESSQYWQNGCAITKVIGLSWWNLSSQWLACEGRERTDTGSVCVCVSSIRCLVWMKRNGRKHGRKIKNEHIERKMLRRKNQLSVDENIWEALFVFEKLKLEGLHQRDLLSGMKNQNVWLESWEPLSGIWCDRD